MPSHSSYAAKAAKEKARIQRLLQVRAQEREASASATKRYRERKSALERSIRHRAEEAAAAHLESTSRKLLDFQANADYRLGKAHADAQRFRREAQQKARRDRTSWQRIDSLAKQRAHEAQFTRDNQPHARRQRSHEQNARERLGTTESFAHAGRTRARQWRSVHDQQASRRAHMNALASQNGPEISGKDVRVSTAGSRLQDFSSSRMHVRTVAHHSVKHGPGTENSLNHSTSLNQSQVKMGLATGNAGVKDAMSAAREVRERNRRRNEEAAERRLRAAEKALARGLGALRKIKARDELPTTMDMLRNLDKVDRLGRAGQWDAVTNVVGSAGSSLRPNAPDHHMRPSGKTYRGHAAFDTYANEEPVHNYPAYVTTELNPRGKAASAMHGELSGDDDTGSDPDESVRHGSVQSAEDESEDERLFERAFMQDQARQGRYEDLLFEKDASEDFASRDIGDAADGSTNADSNSQPLTSSERHESNSRSRSSSADSRNVASEVPGERQPPMQHWFGAQQGDQLLLQRQGGRANDFSSVPAAASEHFIPSSVAASATHLGEEGVNLDDLDRQLSENADWWKHIAQATRALADSDE
eukprot:INCI10198.1.p1 GENE.INCI10198.1~~INCI10198.1.p1  ORF type:complete len:589 (-),score=114.49 INCI10198.1:243-2009(-)